MLANFVRTQQFSGVSQVMVDDKSETILFMNANQAAQGDVSFSEQIRNIDLYKANKKEAEKDFEEFKKTVLESVGV